MTSTARPASLSGMLEAELRQFLALLQAKIETLHAYASSAPPSLPSASRPRGTP